MKVTIRRNANNGRIVSKTYVKKHPSTTVTEHYSRKKV